VSDLHFLGRAGLKRVRRYFIHDEYAGLSAFINRPDEESDRSARMLAIGVIVPLEHGRIGRSWRHAVALKELARYGNKQIWRKETDRVDLTSRIAITRQHWKSTGTNIGLRQKVEQDQVRRTPKRQMDTASQGQ